MKQIIVETVISGLMFLVFLVTLILVILKKRPKKLLLISAIALTATIGIIIYTAYSITDKALRKVSTVLKPRTGEEIYEALLGKPAPACVKVLHYLDQTIPVMDYAIALHFETCPQEFNRIISKRNFLITKEASSSEMITPGVNIKWFKTDTLGDSINVFTALNPDASGQVIYSSLDSSKVMLLNFTN